MKQVTEKGQTCVHCGEPLCRYQGKWLHINGRLDKGWYGKDKKYHVDHIAEPVMGGKR